MIISFDLDFTNFDSSNIKDHFDNLFSEHISNESQWLLDWMTYEDEADEKIDEVNEFVKRINDLGLVYEADMDDFEYDWYEIAMENELARLMAKDD